jgi:hypothetical protein
VDSKGKLKKAAGYAAVIALLVAGTLSGASVLYQLVGHGGHMHGAAAPGALEYLAVTVDAMGAAMMFLLAAQLMSGYRLFRFKPAQFRQVHTRLPWAIVAMLALHGAGAVFHTFHGMPETLPLWLNGMGIPIAATLGIQLTSGYGQSKPQHRRLRAIHMTWALPLALLVSAHAVLGIAHSLTG